MSEAQILNILDRGNTTSAAVFEILDSVRLLTLATVDSHNQPHVNTCYFSNNENLDLFILTPPSARHSEYAKTQCQVAVNIFDTAHKVGDPISGLQLNGVFTSLNDLEGKMAYDNYCKKHQALKKFVPNFEFVLENLESRFFCIRIKSGQIISEPRFGSENYIRFLIER